MKNLLALVLLAGCATKTPQAILEDSDLPDVSVDACLVLDPDSGVDCHEWELKKLGVSDAPVFSYPSVADMPLPQTCMSPKDWSNLSLFIWVALKPIYKSLHDNKVTPEQFNKGLDDFKAGLPNL